MQLLTSSPADFSRLRYPSYKSFDDFIDVQRLKSLDAFLTEKLETYCRGPKADFFLNEHRLDPKAPHQPGAAEIWLTRTKPLTPYDYLDLDKAELWEPTPAASGFLPLMEFIGTLPFKSTARMLIIFDDSGLEVPAHRDHLHTEICHEFIWFRTNLRKPFYMLNHETDEKLYVSSHSAWFDSVNQFHGSEAVPGLCFSVRVDGIFDDEFRKRIPKLHTNVASTPAIWACED